MDQPTSKPMFRRAQFEELHADDQRKVFAAALEGQDVRYQYIVYRGQVYNPSTLIEELLSNVRR